MRSEQEAQVRKLFRDAADLVEQGWCQNRLAEDADGGSVFPEDPQAAKFCLVGALVRANAAAKLPFVLYDGPESHALLTTYWERHFEKCCPVDWNNTPGRAAWEVAERLREMASTK